MSRLKGRAVGFTNAIGTSAPLPCPDLRLGLIKRIGTNVIGRIAPQPPRTSCCTNRLGNRVRVGALA